MQSIFNRAYHPQSFGTTMLTNLVPGNVGKALAEILENNVTLSLLDYVVFIYVFMFLAWILTFAYKICSNLTRFYTCDTGVLALHKATYTNDTLASLTLCQKFPKAINKAIDKDKFTPFLRACYHGNTQLVKYMLERGADLNSCTARNENGIYLAVYNRIRNKNCRDASCIHALYHAGCNINAVNINNLNVLQLSAMFGHTTLVRWLLSKKANFNVKPNPYVLAKNAGHLHTANLLKELYSLTE